MTTPALAEWEAVLDRFELSLRSGEEFEPPLHLGDLPPELLPRAHELIERCRVAIVELEAERSRVVAELRQHRRAPWQRSSRAPSAGAALLL